MSVQVIVATMHQKDYSLLDKMNIQSDAIVCNQCDKTEFTEFEYKGHNIKWLSFTDRGVGLNRNNGLMRATADVVLFADDDEVFTDGYAQIIEDYYAANSQADVVVFNIDRNYDGQMVPIVKREGKATRKDVTKYGAVCISGRREKLHFCNITFHLQFGGGAKYSCGEDTLFLQDCCTQKLKIYISKQTLGYVNMGDSTWFEGYTDKFFYDKGVLYYCINKGLAVLFSLYHCFKHRGIYREYGWKNGFYQMRKGILYCKYGK